MGKTPEQRKADAIVRALLASRSEPAPISQQPSNVSVQPPATPQAPATLPKDEGIIQRLVSFIEQPLFLAAFSILGGIAGLIYTRSLMVVGLCFVGAFHRAKVVSGQSLKVQIPIYILVFVASLALVYEVIVRIKGAVNVPTATEIAEAIKKNLPTPTTQITNVYNPPPKPTHPSPPLTVAPLLLASPIEAGKPIQLIVNMVNTTGRTLDVRLIRVTALMPAFSSYEARVKYEDDEWKRVVTRMQEEGTDEQLPTRSNGQSNIRISTPSVTDTEIEHIIAKKSVPYFFIIYRDLKTKETLVEVCAYLDPESGIRNCARHNKP